MIWNLFLFAHLEIQVEKPSNHWFLLCFSLVISQTFPIKKIYAYDEGFVWASLGGFCCFGSTLAFRTMLSLSFCFARNLQSKAAKWPKRSSNGANWQSFCGVSAEAGEDQTCSLSDNDKLTLARKQNVT